MKKYTIKDVEHIAKKAFMEGMALAMEQDEPNFKVTKTFQLIKKLKIEEND